MSAEQFNNHTHQAVNGSHSNPCPLCFKEDWCFLIGEDIEAVVCGRTDVAPEGWVRVSEAKDGRGVFVKTNARKKKKRSLLPNPESVLPLEIQEKKDIPQWVTLQTVGTESEKQIEYFYPNPETGERMGKVVRKQWTDRRAVYGSKKATKEIRPWHWAKPHRPDLKEGWWSDRGKGTKEYGYVWFPYRHNEIGDSKVVFYGGGEQCVEAYRELGLTATCNQGGEGSYIQQLVDVLMVKKPDLFVISPDNDNTGWTAAEKLRKACLKASVPAVIINLNNVYPNLKEKGDIYNIVVESGMNKKEIVQKLEAEISRTLSVEEAENFNFHPDNNDGILDSESIDPNCANNKTAETVILNTLLKGQQKIVISDIF